MVLSLYCASNNWAMYIEPVSHLGDATNDLPSAGRFSSGNSVLWGTNMASYICKCCIFYVDCSGWSSCNAPYRTAHPRHRDSNASWSSQTDLCGVLKSDTDSIGCFNLAFFQSKRKCTAYSLAAANHSYSNCQYRSLLCGTVSCSRWKFSRLPDWFDGGTPLNEYPNRFLCGGPPKKWAGKIQSRI